MSAEPVQIVKLIDHSFVPDQEALEKILLENDVKDRSIVVISIAGAFRKGKSFLLDFCLRYLHAEFVGKNEGKDWLGTDDEPLVGFAWRDGSERETTGIWMWSELFKHDMPNGEKIAIALMDTQGVFDSKSTVKECSTVFALSTMLSSVLIFNVSQNIQEDDLQHLLFFTDYGRLALAESEKKPFQRLQFLVRDWHFVNEAGYGAKGGQKILKNRLEIQEGQHSELKFLREHLSSCFDDINCFLMPHPGLKIICDFDGRLSLLEPEFRSALRDLIPMLLAPENLVIKQVQGQRVKARDFVQLFNIYNQIFMGDTLPEPKTLLAATAEASNLAAFEGKKNIVFLFACVHLNIFNNFKLQRKFTFKK
uniref:CSON008972 protein n=1 Tax=Culicoides sonorensis TaxID=179676 RepID=A0A336LZC1_CULSO